MTKFQVTAQKKLQKPRFKCKISVFLVHFFSEGEAAAAEAEEGHFHSFLFQVKKSKKIEIL